MANTLYKRSDYKHMWWLITVAFKCFINGDTDGSMEALFWLRMHMSHDSTKIKKEGGK